MRPIEMQLEALVFVPYYLNKLAAFVLNVFPSKILQGGFCSLNVVLMSKIRCALSMLAVFVMLTQQ